MADGMRVGPEGEDAFVNVQRATPEDAPAIAAVLAAAFLPYRAMYTQAAFEATTPSAPVVRARFAEGPAWIALAQAGAVGTVAAVPRGRDLYVRSMAVLPSAAGTGIGRRLLRAVEESALAAGHARLVLSTTPFLGPAIRLYEAAGFRRTGDGPHDLHGTPLVGMAKDLR